MGYEGLQFPKDSTFLVTGAAGFIGSNLVEAILKLGYRVRGFDNFSTGKRENVEEFAHDPNYEFIEGDIRDFESCMKACEGIDFVLHQAAWGSVPRSIEKPLLYEEINIKGTLNMMEAAKRNDVKRFVYASSSSVYGDHPNLPKIEGVEGNVLSPYALTKKTNEEYGRLYTKLYGLRTYGLRYFNVFGKRQDANSQYAAVIPKFVRQILNNESPTIFGDGKQSRDFTYIENVIEANLKACCSTDDAAGKVFNVAYGTSISVLEVFDILRKLLKKDVEPKFAPERVGDIKNSLADITCAKRMLGYSPDWSFLSGIQVTIDWYKENLNGTAG